VSARAVENDAPDRPDWPGLVTMTVRSSSWISRQLSWPYRRPTASADAEALRRRAERIARRLDVRFADAYPPGLLEGLGRLARRAARCRAEPRDRCSLARYGLTAPPVDAAFARYAEFVRANKVRLE